MDRRKFLETSALGAALLAIDPLEAVAKPASFKVSRKEKAKSDYSIVILGDTHFDTEPESVYHSDYDEKVEWLNRVQRAEFKRNGEMWRERCPRMVKRAAGLVGEDTRMVFQMGDLIQGDCGNPEVHKRMLSDVMDYFKNSLGGLPFMTVCGNHDIRGTKAAAAYDEYMPARLSEELGRKISKTTFAFTIGPDAYIFIDFERPDAALIEKLLHDTEGARYTFVVVHGPVFPYDASSCRWFLLGRQKYTEQRLHIRQLFAKRDVIVLCGHTHRVELADWFGDGGRITQMTMNSVWSKDELDHFILRSRGSAEYGELRKKARNDDGSNIKDETALFDEYRPGLKRYIHGTGAGSFKLHVSGHGVVVDFYGGDSEEITESFVLR